VGSAFRGAPDIQREPNQSNGALLVRATHLFATWWEPGSYQGVGFDSNARQEGCSRQAHMLPNQQYCHVR